MTQVLLDPCDFLISLYDAAVQRAQPAQVMASFMPEPPAIGAGRTVVVGAGKAAGAMAQAFEHLWLKRNPHAPLSGMVVTRYGHTPHLSSGGGEKIKIIEAAHPVPDQAGLAAAEAILALVQGLTTDDLVVCLISGGGSSLLSLPCAGLALSEKQAINRALLVSGVTIAEMNCVRKHLSRIKGGRLAKACGAARLVTLAISDVPGDDLSVIASGPTVVDKTTCADALAILAKYTINLPPSIDQALRDGTLETPKTIGLEASSPAQIHLIATPQQSLEAAAQKARASGVNAYILSDEIEGESREVAKVHAALALSAKAGKNAFKTPCVILSGGETTVTVRPPAKGQQAGKGGRAGEFCLGLAQSLQGVDGVWALAADTDGIDGNEDNAGAFVMPDTLQRANRQGLAVSDYLARHDAYRYFAALNDLHITGATYTNVNDFRAIYIAS